MKQKQQPLTADKISAMTDDDLQCEIDRRTATGAAEAEKFRQDTRKLHNRIFPKEDATLQRLCAEQANRTRLAAIEADNARLKAELAGYFSLEPIICQLQRLARLTSLMATEGPITDETEDFIIMLAGLASDEADKLKDGFYAAHDAGTLGKQPGGE